MAWDWVGTVSTAAVGALGIWGTSRTTDKQIAAQRDQSRDERQEARLEASYTELLSKVGQADDWAYQLMLRWFGEAQTTTDRPPIYVRSISSLGVLSVHWSPRVRQMVDELRDQIDVAYKAWIKERIVDRPATEAGQRPDAAGLMANYQAFQGAKERISALDHQIRDQVHAELTGAHDGHAQRG